MTPVSCSRVGRDPARAGRGCGGHAEHGAVPAAGAARVARGERRGRAARVARVPRVPARRQARVLRQRQRHAPRQAPARLRDLPGLQRGRKPPHSDQRRRRLAQGPGVLLPDTLLKHELVNS